jgi:NitT/TauT family transport system substrate-binding protein
MLKAISSRCQGLLIMKMNKRTAVVTPILIIIMLIITACGANTTAPSTNLRAIRIGGNPWIGNAAIYIAVEKGLFAKAGVKVEYVKFDSPSASNNAFATKQIDAALMTLPDAVAQVAAKVPLQVVWLVDSSMGADFVIGTSAIKSPADLKGKRIGMAYGSFGHFFIMSGLAKYGLTRDDITVVNVNVDGIAQALKDGKIDAGHTYDPFAAQAIKDGAHVIFTSADTPGAIDDIMAFQQSIIDKRPDDVKTILRVMQEAMAYWAAHPEEGNKIVATNFGVAVEEIPQILKTVHILTLAEVQAAFDQNNTPSLYKSVATIGEFFTSEKITQQAPDPKAALNSTFAMSLSTK